MAASVHRDQGTGSTGVDVKFKHLIEMEPAAIELDAIAALSDPIGVLSVYVDADPALVASPRPAWEAPIRAGLRRLGKSARRKRPRDEWMALRERLDELERELETLLDPRSGRRGRALFAAVSGSEIHRVGVDIPFAPFVALDRHARVLPLLAAMQDGRRAGAVTLSWDRLESAEWHFDQLDPLETIELAQEEPQPRPATHPAVPQPFPERDRFESAAGARVLSLLRDAGKRLARQARARGWDIVVVDGDPRLADALSDAFRTDFCRLVRAPQPIGGLQNAVAVDRVGSTVRAVRAERDAELLRRLDESSAATRDPRVLDRSLREGRVEHLLIAAASNVPASEESESLLRRARDQGAEVTILSPGTASLGPLGAAALVRW